MARGRIGLFGTKKSKKSLPSDIEADDFIAQLFEQEPDFSDLFDEPSGTSSTSRSSKTKTPKTSSKTTSKSAESSNATKSPKVKTTRKSTKFPKSTKKPKLKKSSSDATISDFVQTYDDLLAVLAAHCPHVTLLDNIIAPENILINYDVTIDFNGFSIVSDESHSVVRVLDIRSGKVVLTGRGKIFAMGKQGVAIRTFGAISSGVPNYTNLTVGPEISLFAPDSYGILISPNLGVAYGLTINFAGQIFAHDGIGLSGAIRADDRHLPTINILESAHIVADETSGVAIEAAGYGQWGITGARLTGAAAASLSIGELSFLNSQLLARDITFNLCPSAAHPLKLTIDGGTYVAERGANISGEKSTTTKLSLKSGNFYAPELLITKNLKPLLKTKGRAKFSKNVAKILAELIPTPAADEIHLDTSDVAVSEPIPESNSPENIPSESLIQPNSPENTPSNNSIRSNSTPEPTTDALTESTLATNIAADNFTASNSISDAVPDSVLAEESNESALTETGVTPDQITSSKSTLIESEAATSATTPSAPEITSSTKPETITDPANLSEPEIASEPALTKIKPETIPTSNPSIIPSVTPVLNPTESSTLASAQLVSNFEPTSPPQPTFAASPVFSRPIPSFTAYPATPVIDEQTAARAALADAISDIRKLNSEEYGTNFSYLEQTIQRAEQILSDPRTTLQDIFTTAGELLQAFDGLQESDNFSLSDDELDELFYHGAVLEEMVSEPQDELTSAVIGLTYPEFSYQDKTTKASHTNLTNGLSPAAVANQLSLQVQAYDETEVAATDFGKMVDLLNLVASLDLNRYLATSQTTLLEALAEAEEILNDPTCSQEEVDDITERITDGLQELELVRLAHLTGRSRRTQPKLNIPAPIVHQPIPIIMIDEMAPSANWSTGVTMIDEMDPYVADPDTLEKMIRATQPVVTAFFETIASPVKKLSRSLSAGFQAGLTAYRDTLHAAKG